MLYWLQTSFAFWAHTHQMCPELEGHLKKYLICTVISTFDSYISFGAHRSGLGLREK